jgi:tungstate transport system permease protein
MSFFQEAFGNAAHLIFGFDPEVWRIVETSLRVSIIATIGASLAGLPIGLTIALNRFRGKSAVLVLLNTLMAFPTVVIGLLFYAFLSRRGPLGHLGFLYQPVGMSIGLFVLALPVVVNLSLAAVQGQDRNLILTCKLLGAGPFQQALKILKEARFAVMASVVTAFGRVISEVGVAMMLGGNIRGLTRTMTTAIALETSKGEFDSALALGIVLLTVALTINALLFMLQRTAGR